MDCLISIAPYGIIEYDSNQHILQEYKWVNITRIGTDDTVKAFFFQSTERTKIFFVENLEILINACKQQLYMLGLHKIIPITRNFDIQTVIIQRNNLYLSLPIAISIFHVSKITKRSLRPISRQLHITEEYIIEKDSSGFQFSSFQRIDNIYAIVRNWKNNREFTIEYNNNTSRIYISSMRDTILSMLLDICHACNNIRVIITGEISDNLRLMPRYTEENYETTIRDTFFGCNSIETWYLTRLYKLCTTLTTIR